MSSKSVIVTGVSSFVGCHLARGFHADGWEVFAVTSRPLSSYEGIRRQRLQYLEGKVRWAVLDISDERASRDLVAKIKPTLWLHHGGFATDYASLNYDVQKAYAINMKPLYFLFDALSQQKVSGLIVTGSSMEYSDSERACLEEDPCFPNTPYGLSKLMETLVSMQLSWRYRLPVRIARLFIPFGPLDSPSKLLPKVLDHLRQKKPLDLTPCTQRRDFVYIEDVVQAYLLLADDMARLGNADIFNICSGEGVSLHSVLEDMADRLGVSHHLLRFGMQPMRSGEGMVSYGCNDKARRRLGWRPRSLRQGIDDFLKGVLL